MTYTASHAARYRPARTRFGLFSLLGLWRSRQDLKALDDRALADIGISRKEAANEAKRPVWDVPHTWRD